MASYTVAASLFIISSSYLLHFVVDPPGNSVASLEHLALRTAAESALDVIVNSHGSPDDWGDGHADTVRRLGLVEKGTTIRIDSDKFDALARGERDLAGPNNAVDYAEAKEALGLSGHDFHLVARPVVPLVHSAPYGVSGFSDFRVAYVADHEVAGLPAVNAPTATAAAERDALNDLAIAFEPTLKNAVGIGDVFSDDSAFLRSHLLPNIGIEIAQTVISGSSGSSTYNFYRVDKTAYQGLTTTNASATLTSAMALSSDGATLGYTKSRELRAIIGSVDLTGQTQAELNWWEWVDTDRGNASYDCGDYGYVEVSHDEGTTWVKLTDTALDRSDDCATLPAIPHLPALTARKVANVMTLCAACAGDPNVLIAFHWIADNDNNIGYGWVVDDVTIDVGAVATTRALRKTFETPTYDMVVVGSGISHTAFTPNDIKTALRDYVEVHGGRLVVTGPGNVQWLDRLFDADTAPYVATPPTDVDHTHPLLKLPNELDHAGYTPGSTWDFTGSIDAERFVPIVSRADDKHLLAVSKAGAWGAGSSAEGSVILSSYIPGTIGVEQARRFFANVVTYGKFHHLYLDIGPDIPDDLMVGSVSRSATMNMHRTGAPEYIEMSFALYVWPGASSSDTLQSVTTYASAPRDLAATAAPGKVTLTWKSPIAFGTEDSLRFHVWRGSSPHGTTETPLLTIPYAASTPDLARVFTTEITGLTNGQTYYFNVTLETALPGQGTSSATVSATPFDIPDKPTINAPTGTVGGVTVTWNAPTNPGIGTIYGYRVYSSSDGVTYTLAAEVGSVLSYTLASADSTAYSFKVEALGGGGWSARSDASLSASALVPVGPPSLTLTRGDGPNNITLSWTAPGSFLGQTPLGYRIWRATPTGSFAELAYINTAANVSFKDAGLGPDATYRYKMQAVTNVGDGLLTAEQTERTMRLPDAPPYLHVPTIVPIVNTVAINWTAPASESPIVRYDVYRAAANDLSAMVFLRSTTLPLTTDTVTPGPTYWYAVKAISAAGSSAYSATDSTAS